jgi:peptidoglycan hydrolase-like protein with peptidoglycan-binding domain
MSLRLVVLFGGVLVLTTACGTGESTDTGGSRNSDAASTAAAPPTITPPTAAATSSIPATAPPATSECRYVDAPPIPPPADLRIERGDCGPGVYRLQQMLAEIGYSIAADGQFGPATEAVVKQYQQRRGALAVNGIVDATLWADLDYQSTA